MHTERERMLLRLELTCLRIARALSTSDEACEGGLLLALGLWGIVLALWVWAPGAGLPWGFPR